MPFELKNWLGTFQAAVDFSHLQSICSSRWYNWTIPRRVPKAKRLLSKNLDRSWRYLSTLASLLNWKSLCFLLHLEYPRTCHSSWISGGITTYTQCQSQHKSFTNCLEQRSIQGLWNVCQPYVPSFVLTATLQNKMRWKDQSRILWCLLNSNFSPFGHFKKSWPSAVSVTSSKKGI